MSSTFIKPAEKVKSFKPYFFSTLGKKINELRKDGLDVIRIDMGSPDLPPDSSIIERLVDSARDLNQHGYMPHGGPIEYKEAIAAYYKRRFNVSLDPKTEVVGLIGSKEGLFDLPTLLVNPGEYVLLPDPGYPVYTTSAEYAGAKIHYMPLLAENDFRPNLQEIPAEVLKTAKIIWINYPNNPTGAVAPHSFFEEIIAFAKKHKIVVAHDAPYTEVCFDDYVAPSLLQIPGAKDVAIEFNSLSKAYNMGGWRLGMACGNETVVSLLHTLRSQASNSHFGPIFKAGIAALTESQDWLIERNNTYKERRDIVVNALRPLGFEIKTPPATIYIWARIPEKYSDSFEFCDHLLREAGVSTTPGDVYGPHGAGYIRISLGAPTDKIQEAVRRIENWSK